MSELEEQGTPDAAELQDMMNDNTPFGESSEEVEAAPEQVEAPYLSWEENGKQIQATKDQALKWAQQGRGANLKIGELNQSMSGMKQELESLKTYKQVDDWAKQNPEAWAHIQQNYQGGQTQQYQLPEEMQPHLEPVLQELNSLKSFVNELKQEKQQQKVMQEDTALETEIQSIREKYKDLDWETRDEAGQTIEYKVLEHASKIGTTSFDAAFKSLMHEKLIERARLSAKEQMVKEKQTKRRLGLLGDTQAPTKLGGLSYDPSRASETDVFSAALKEYTG